jgi:serine/threonine protein kinase
MCTRACCIHTLSLQLSGRDYDEKTDIYSLGIMLFEMSHPSFRTAMERTIVRTLPLLKLYSYTIHSVVTYTIVKLLLPLQCTL